MGTDRYARTEVADDGSIVVIPGPPRPREPRTITATTGIVGKRVAVFDPRAVATEFFLRDLRAVGRPVTAADLRAGGHVLRTEDDGALFVPVATEAEWYRAREAGDLPEATFYAASLVWLE